MSEIVVLASLVARPGREADAERLLTDLLAPVHAEEGCLLYALHRATDDPARLQFVERWASQELLDSHLHSEHILRALEEVPEIFSHGPDISYFHALPGGEPIKGSLAGHQQP